MKKFCTCLAFGLTLLLCTSPVLAALADLHPPAWRGDAGTTLQGWDFLNVPVLPPTVPVLGIIPDVVEVNPNGPVLLDYYPGFNQQALPFWEGMYGVLPLSGTIEIGIPNFPIQNPYKEIIVQVIWAPQAPGNGMTVTEPLNGGTVTLLEEHPFDPYWTYSLYQIEIWPNPDFEVVRIDGGIFVDSVFVDTICTVPEPATLALLGIGGLLMRKKK